MGEDQAFDEERATEVSIELKTALERYSYITEFGTLELNVLHHGMVTLEQLLQRRTTYGEAGDRKTCTGELGNSLQAYVIAYRRFRPGEAQATKYTPYLDLLVDASQLLATEETVDPLLSPPVGADTEENKITQSYCLFRSRGQSTEPPEARASLG